MPGVVVLVQVLHSTRCARQTQKYRKPAGLCFISGLIFLFITKNETQKNGLFFLGTWHYPRLRSESEDAGLCSRLGAGCC
jgi:hypothetical protein